MRYQTAPHSDILLYDFENVLIKLIKCVIAIEVHIIGLNFNLVNTFFIFFLKISKKYRLYYKTLKSVVTLGKD